MLSEQYSEEGKNLLTPVSQQDEEIATGPFEENRAPAVRQLTRSLRASGHPAQNSRLPLGAFPGGRTGLRGRARVLHPIVAQTGAGGLGPVAGFSWAALGSLSIFPPSPSSCFLEAAGWARMGPPGAAETVCTLRVIIYLKKRVPLQGTYNGCKTITFFFFFFKDMVGKIFLARRFSVFPSLESWNSYI